METRLFPLRVASFWVTLANVGLFRVGTFLFILQKKTKQKIPKQRDREALHYKEKQTEWERENKFFF